MLKLKHMIPLLGLLMSMAIISYEYVSLLNNLEDRERQYSEETLRNTANNLQGDLNDQFAHADMAGVRRAISGLNFLPLTRLVYLLDDQDMIIAAGQLALVGKRPTADGQYFDQEAFSQARTTLSGKVLKIRNGSILVAAYPITLGINSGEFRPSRVGIVVIVFDISANLAEIKASVVEATVRGALVVLVVLLFGALIVHIFFTKRVQMILDSAREYTSGNPGARCAVTGRDELANISKAFNCVADSVEKAKLELQKNEQRLSSAQRIANLGSWQWEIATGKEVWSDEFFRIFGMAPQEIEPTFAVFMHSVHPQDRNKVQAAIDQSLRDKSEYSVQHRIVRPDGEERVVWEQGELFLDDAGEASIVIGTALDITDRHRAEQEVKQLNESLEQRVKDRTAELQSEIQERQAIEGALKETEAKTRQIVNSAVDGIITTDEQGVILSFNTAAEKIFGYSIFEIIGKNITILMPSNIAKQHGQFMKEYLQRGKGKVIGMGRELVARRKDGGTFLADFSISDFIHGDDITFVGIIRDITERKEEQYRLQATLEQLQSAQDELVQAEKMASLGGLVAGVAHEINTPIGVGVTAVSHLKERADHVAQLFRDGGLRKSDFAEFVEAATASSGIIQTNLNRASDLIKSFKQVAVDQTSEEKRRINVLEYAEEVLESLKPNLRRTLHEICVQGDRDVLIDTHPGALSQVITNLVMNSVIHAYDEGDVGHIQLTIQDCGDRVSVLYADDGKGMDEDVCSKIFEPFFTTKRGSGGSGLGMHILFNQVTQTLGGSIELHSTPGRGTAFEISIPYKTGDIDLGEQQ